MKYAFINHLRKRPRVTYVIGDPPQAAPPSESPPPARALGLDATQEIDEIHGEEDKEQVHAPCGTGQYRKQ